MKSKLAYFLLYLFCLHPTIAWGQPDRTDSILRVISGLTVDKQTDTLNSLSLYYYTNTQYYQAKRVAEEALRLAETHSLVKGKCEAMKNIAEAYYGLNDFHNAISFYQRAATLNGDQNDRIAEAYCLNCIGYAYRSLNNYKEALNFHLKSLKISEETVNPKRISAAVHAIALVYHYLHDYRKAFTYYERSMKVDSARGDWIGVALNLNNIGTLCKYIEPMNPQKALDYYQKALNIYTELNYKTGLACMYCNMANIYLESGDIPKALKFHLKSLRLEEELKSQEGIAVSYACIGDVYNKAGDISQAIRYKEKALEITQDVELKQGVYDSLRVMYTTQKNFRKALYCSLQSSICKDSMLNLESQRQILEFQTKYEIEKKENQIKNLKSENLIETLKVEKQKTYIYYFILIVIILILTVFIFIFKYRIRQIREKELEILVSERTKELLEEIKIRKEAQDDVRQLADDLEQKVISRTAQLEAAYSELESFSYSVSHDLRAPARRISGMSQALLEDYSSHFEDAGRDYISRIIAASHEMNQLIEDILNLSRITRQDLIKEEFDLSELARDVCKKIRENDPQREVDIEIPSQIQVSGDRRLLQIVIQNLFDNAWKYTGKTKDPSIQFGCLNQEGKTIIFLRDNGIGFDMNQYDKLFTPFQRLHSADQFSGTGVGLATVNRIIHKHNGVIWAESEPGKGATFFFTLMAD